MRSAYVLKRLVSSLTTFTFMLSTVNISAANAAAEKKYSNEQKMAAYVRVAGGMPVQNFSSILAATRIDEESLKTIHTDLAFRLGNAKMPNLSMKGNQMMVDGKGTGIRITSYDPMTVTYKNKEWKYKKDLSVAQNYFALGSFLNTKSTASALSILIEPAHAEIGETIGYAIGGAILGIGLALVAIYGTAGLIGASIPIAILALFTAGGVAIGRNEDSKKEVARDLLSQKVTVACNENAMTVLSSDPRNKSLLRVTKGTAAIELKDRDGDNINIENISQDVAPIVAQVRAQAATCNSAADAKKIENEINMIVENIAKMNAPLGACQTFGNSPEITCEGTHIKIASKADGSSVRVHTGTAIMLDAKDNRIASPSESVKICVNALRAEMATCKKEEHVKALQAKINAAPAPSPSPSGSSSARD